MLIFQRNLLIFDLPIKRYLNNKPLSHFSKTHFSNIPLFHYSNWGEAPKFYFGQNRFIPRSFSIVGTVFQTLPNIFNTPSACGGAAA
jgi:hypothetical protein